MSLVFTSVGFLYLGTKLQLMIWLFVLSVIVDGCSSKSRIQKILLAGTITVVDLFIRQHISLFLFKSGIVFIMYIQFMLPSLHKRNNSDDFEVNNSWSSSGPRIVVETSSRFIFGGLLFFEGHTFGNLYEFSSSCVEFRNILRPFQGIKHTGCSLFTVRRLIVI